MTVVETLVSVCAPFAHLYNKSKALELGTTYAHLASMLAAGGLAISSDRQTLRVPSTDRDAVMRLVTEQGTLHRLVIAGLVVSAISGAMMFAADVETFWGSWLYWSKMTGVVLLLGNGWLLQRAERGLLADPLDATALARLRWSAIASLMLWFTVALLGTVLKTEA